MANPFEVRPPDPIGVYTEQQTDLARLAGLQQQAKGLELRNAQTLEEMASGAEFKTRLKSIDPTLGVVDKLEEMSDLALQTGRFGDAEKAISLASMVDNRKSLADARKAQEEARRTQASEKRVGRALQLMRGMNDEISKQMMEEMYQQEFGKPSPTAWFPYSPQLRDSAIAALEQGATREKKAADEALAVSRLAAIERADKVAQAQIGYFEARSRAVEERATTDRKSGGKAVAVTATDVKLAESKISNEFPDLEKKERELAAREIAADAKAIQAREYGSYADAVDKALAARRGQFAKMPRVQMGPIELGSKTKYIPKAVAEDMAATGVTEAEIDIAGTKGKLTTPTPPGPKPGDVYKGYRFKGGNPGDKANWEKL